MTMQDPAIDPAAATGLSSSLPAAAARSLSSVSVIGNSLRPRRLKLEEAAK
jgi:cation transport ATPase